ncbi:MAG: hypothetical protein ACFHWZ_07585 [Phycisphaerales bacterium]
MKRTLTTLGALAILAGAAHAGEISQSVDVNITPDAPIQEFVLNGFDTMGGNRVLTGVRYQLQTSMSAEFTVLNYSDFPIPAGEWQALPGFSMFFTADEPGGDGEDSIFGGIGGIGFDPLTGDLPAGSGDPIFGEPGRLEFSDTGTLESDFLDDGEVARNFFSTHETIASTLAPFSFPEIFGPPGANIALESQVTQTGTLTVIYEFTEIPAPGAAALFGLAGLGATRRRR